MIERLLARFGKVRAKHAGKETFLCLPARACERGRGTESERTIRVKVATRSARGTLSAILKIGASLVK